MSRYQYPFKGFYALRFEVLERDQFTCRYCGQKAPNVMLEADHVIPWEDGGEDKLDNLVTACMACNRGRSGLIIRRKRMTQTSQWPNGYVSLGTRIVDILKQGSRTTSELAKELRTKANIVKVTTTRLKIKGIVMQVGMDGKAYRWGLNLN